MRRPAQAVVVHGVTGGLLAGLVVALWFLVADTLAGHSFRTPTLLAGVVLNREFTEVGFRLVAVYTVLHFGVFAILGVGMAWVSAAFAAPPRLLLSLMFGVLLQEVTFYVGLLVLHAPHLGVIAWPHVVGELPVGGRDAIVGAFDVFDGDPHPFASRPHDGAVREPSEPDLRALQVCQRRHIPPRRVGGCPHGMKPCGVIDVFAVAEVESGYVHARLDQGTGAFRRIGGGTEGTDDLGATSHITKP